MKHLSLFKTLICLCCALFLSGCATLDYVGEDYNSSNAQLVKTTEDFVFNTYKKTTQVKALPIVFDSFSNYLALVLLQIFIILFFFC